MLMDRYQLGSSAALPGGRLGWMVQPAGTAVLLAIGPVMMVVMTVRGMASVTEAVLLVAGLSQASQAGGFSQVDREP